MCYTCAIDETANLFAMWNGRGSGYSLNSHTVGVLSVEEMNEGDKQQWSSKVFFEPSAASHAWCRCLTFALCCRVLVMEFTWYDG